MKVVTLLASVLITCISCNCQKKAVEQSNVIENKQQDELGSATIQKEMKLEYEANTRGYFRKIVVQNKTIAVSKDREGKDLPRIVPISDADWQQLTAFLEKVNLDQLPNLKAPTEKRFYDGAPIANFRVLIKDKVYESAAFDGGFPPAEIENIVNAIVALADKQE